MKKGRVLHHGTLLYDADLNRLRRYLRPPGYMVESKSVKSVRSQVANIRDYVDDKNMTIGQFKDFLAKSICDGNVEKLNVAAGGRSNREACKRKVWNMGMELRQISQEHAGLRERRRGGKDKHKNPDTQGIDRRMQHRKRGDTPETGRGKVIRNKIRIPEDPGNTAPGRVA